jgi:FMN phosphatase YigB (HAD superfamily)/predicted O-methyltransferase YrrM
MWNYLSDNWVLGTPQFEADATDPERRTGPWSGHRRFAYDLVRNGQPDVIVELGTHYGVSFFSFCQAVKDGGLATRLHAVDTWKGEEHAGFYGEEVIERVRTVIDRHYDGLAIRLHRCLFDDALREFADGSIDLLHIDGFHSYEAVQHDFTTWLPKLAPNGVIIFHDVDPASGYGSADFWRELCEQHPTLTFPHSFGLGVLFPKGTAGHQPLLAARPDLLITAYAERATRELLEIQVGTLTEMVDARDEAIQSQTAMIEDRDQLIKAQDSLITSLRETISANELFIDTRDETIAVQTRLLEERDEVIDSQAKMIAERDAKITRLTEEMDTLVADRASSSPPFDGSDAAEPSDPVAPPASHNTTAALRTLAARELRRQHAIARAVAPHLPEGMVRAGVKAKRAVTRSAIYNRARGRPAPEMPSVVPDAFSTVFDAEFYIETYGAPRYISPARHYLLHGWFRQLDPSPFFSVKWYLSAYPEVAAAGQEPLTHYLEHGYRAGYNPQPWFDGAWYAAENPDLDLGCMSPLEHYITTGIATGTSVSEAHFRLLVGSRERARSRLSGGLTATVFSAEADEVTLPFESLPVSGFDLITVDLWDTLLRRTRPADAAKVATARRMMLRLGGRATAGVWELFEQRVATEALLASEADDEEYELTNVLSRVLTNLGCSEAEARGLADELADAEVDDEINTTHPVPEVAAFVHRVVQGSAAPVVAVLSDFYIGEQRLQRLLQAHGFDLPVFSSCEIGGSKRLATAFSIVRQRLDRADGRHLHIGDHPTSDGRNAVSSGATAVVVHVPEEAGLPRPGALDTSYYDGLLDRLAAELLDLGVALAPNELDRPLERESFLAGVASATLPVALVSGAIDLAIEQDADKIFYLSREGSFLARLHREIGNALVDGRAPSAVHLEVSRRSTFGASINDTYDDCAARLWRQYPSQSLRGFLVSLGLEPAAFESTAVRIGLPLDDVLPEFKDDLRFREFLEVPAVASSMREAFVDQRRRLNAYLDGHGFPGQSPIVVDIGWRGTIQDNLCYIRRDTIIHGVYLGLFPYLHQQPVNARKRAVVFDGNHGEEFTYVSPPAAIESPWTPRVPTTFGYRWEQDGVAVATGRIEEGRADALVAAYQRGVMAGAELVAHTFATNGAVTSLLRNALQGGLRSYFEHPLPGVSDIWFFSEHDDTFGALNVTPFGKLCPPVNLAYRDTPVHDTDEARASLWAAGYAQWRPVRALTAIRALRKTG